MGQKVNPISLRLEQTNRHFDSCWFNDYNYTNLLNRDINIQSYINLVLKQIKYSSARFFIQNLPNKIKINVFFLNPKSLRKSVSGAFQLKDSFKVRNLAAAKRKSKQIQKVTRTLKLVKKNAFLKHYKMDKNSKVKALNYLLLQNIDKKNCTEKTLPQESLHPITDGGQNLMFSKYDPTREVYGEYLEIQFLLRYLLLQNFSLKFKEKPLPLAVTGRATGQLLRLSPPSQMGNNETFLSQKVKKNVNNQTQCFLFSNLRNLRFLNNKNKLFLTTNFLKNKIRDYKQHLQEDIIQNKIKFSSLIPVVSSGTTVAKKNNHLAFAAHHRWGIRTPTKNLTLKNQDYTALSTAKPNIVKSKEGKRKSQWLIQNDAVNDSFLTLSSVSNTGNFNSLTENQQNSHTSLVGIKHFNKIKKAFYNPLLYNTTKVQNTNLNYFFLSLVNNQSLKKSHKNYNKIFKDFSQFSSSYLPDLNKKQVLTLNKAPYLTSLGQQKKKHEVLEKSYKINKKKVLFLRNSSYKTHVESQLSNALFSDVAVSFFRFSNEKQSAVFLAEEIVYYLEKRVPFFKIKNQILREIHKSSFVKGLRITCSGRVGGRSKKAQRAKIQIIKYGQTSLHVFSSKIDFASKYAHTSFGLLGIKVWICYN